MDLQSNMDAAQSLAKNFSDEMHLCIQNCTGCHQVCVQTITHCLNKGGPHAAPEHIKALQDCAEICAASANFMIRGSDLHHSVCGVCAQACRTCASSCEEMTGEDEMMEMCADVCRRCAESCEKMAGAAKH